MVSALCGVSARDRTPQSQHIQHCVPKCCHWQSSSHRFLATPTSCLLHLAGSPSHSLLHNNTVSRAVCRLASIHIQACSDNNAHAPSWAPGADTIFIQHVQDVRTRSHVAVTQCSVHQCRAQPRGAPGSSSPMLAWVAAGEVCESIDVMITWGVSWTKRMLKVPVNYHLAWLCGDGAATL